MNDKPKSCPFSGGMTTEEFKDAINLLIDDLIALLDTAEKREDEYIMAKAYICDQCKDLVNNYADHHVQFSGFKVRHKNKCTQIGYYGTELDFCSFECAHKWIAAMRESIEATSCLETTN